MFFCATITYTANIYNTSPAYVAGNHNIPTKHHKKIPAAAGIFVRRRSAPYCSPAICVARCMAAWRRICCIGTSGGTGPWLSYFTALVM